MNIKTWDQRIDEQPGSVVTRTLDVHYAMQAEIDELRAALQERDASYMDGYEGGKQEARDAAHTEIDAQRKVLEQARDVLKYIGFVPRADGSHPVEMLYAAIQEQLNGQD